MKNFTFLMFFSVLCFAYKAQTTVYHPLPDSNACWKEYAFWGYTCPVQEYRYFHMDGDTILNGIAYHKIVYSRMYFCNSGPYYDGATHYIRQDTAQRMVYYFSPNSNSEEVLYDFNLLAGNTFITEGMDYTIVTVDSISISGSYRKRWLTDKTLRFTGDTICFIEGISSTSGLLHPLYGDQGIENGTQLTSYNQNGQCLYQYVDAFGGTIGEPCSCSVTASAPFSSFKKFNITVAPNPARTTITVNSVVSLQKIEISDIQGRPVYTVNSVGKSITIDVSKFESGVYYIKTSAGVTKFIKE